MRDALALCAMRESRSVAAQAEYFIKEGLLKYNTEHPDFNPQWQELFGDSYPKEE